MQDKANTVLRVEGLSKAYGNQQVLNNLAFSIKRAERVAIVGPSGSGKSTMLNCLAGLETPDSGRIEFLGRDLVGMPEAEVTELRRGNLTSVFQFFHLLPTLQARENVEFPLLLENASRSERKEKVGELLEEVGLTHRSRAWPSELSGGEMQRLAIARALITEPAMILADEPTGSLDAKNSERILELLSKLAERHGTALLIVTHDPVASADCDRILHMLDGKLDEGAVEAQTS
ncbi:MAG: ABC transporter ATP-binding protein [Puniceicoccaceae bacterium]